MTKANPKFTVITGASSGIGYAAAIAFAKRGKHLIVIARRLSELNKLKQEIAKINPNLKIIIKICDLSDSSNVYGLFNELKEYVIETWINNAGYGHYGSVGNQDLNKIQAMLKVNIEALTLFSTLYTRSYHNVPGTQLINISSRGGYTIVPNAVTYCATKFYVSAFTEGLANELRTLNAHLKAKVLAPAATETEFAKVANATLMYDYAKHFKHYHTANEMADFLLVLYDSEYTIGEINTTDFSFSLKNSIFPYAK